MLLLYNFLEEIISVFINECFYLYITDLFQSSTLPQNKHCLSIILLVNYLFQVNTLTSLSELSLYLQVRL